MTWKKFKRWLQALYKRPSIIDSSVITKKLFVHVVYVNAAGVLCFYGKNVIAEITGVSEWPEEIKTAYNVDLSTTVVDIVINPLNNSRYDADKI